MAYESHALPKVPIQVAILFGLPPRKRAMQAADEYEASLRTCFSVRLAALPALDWFSWALGPPSMAYRPRCFPAQQGSARKVAAGAAPCPMGRKI